MLSRTTQLAYLLLAGISHVCMAETPPRSSLETVDDGVVNAADYLLVQAVQTPARTPSAPTVPPSNNPLPLPAPPTIVPTLPQSTPTPNPAIASARRPRTSRFANTRIASRIPYMIGDSSGGGCGTLTFDGAPFADVEHPTFACSRLNIAENNSPIPQSRAFLSYRHFHNLSNTEILGESNSLNMDQYTLGLERALLDGDLSLEVRVPIARELNSDLDIYSTPARDNLPLSDMQGEFGNISLILKRLLAERCDFILSGGIAVNFPTADDVRIRGDFETDINLIDDPIVIDAFADFTFDGLVRNETVNLSPFLAWQYTPDSRFFHQGFLQIDIPMNKSQGSVTIDGVVTPDILLPPEVLAVNERGRIDQQTLLRLNLGGGYWVHRGSRNDTIRGIAALFELHYTATLDDANPFRREIVNYTLGPLEFPVDLLIGNQFDHINIVNLSTGFTVDFGGLLVTNGFTAPLTTDQNKPFDFEYNLQIQRRF